jgi:transposase
MWCVADLTDDYLEKMEEVLEVYERPYNPAEPVVCLDEKPVTLHDDVRPARPMAPGKPRRPDNEYKRCGTANVFCAVEPKAGKHFTLATPNRSAAQLAPALEGIIANYSGADTIHLVMDNLNIHGPKTLTDYFGKEKGTELWRRLTVHYTPKHGSWLNQAEIEISLLARQCLAKRRIPTLAILQRETAAWNAKANHDRVKINWQFTRRKARQKFGYKRPKRNRFTRSKT